MQMVSVYAHSVGCAPYIKKADISPPVQFDGANVSPFTAATMVAYAPNRY